MAEMHSTPFLFILAMSLLIACHAGCPEEIRLPQDEPFQEYNCKAERENSLEEKRKVYGIKRATPDMPYNRLDMDIPTYVAHLFKNSFLSSHSTLWAGQGILFKATEYAYLMVNTFNSQTMKDKDYADARDFFRIHTSTASELINIFKKHSSAATEQFLRDFFQWIADMNLVKVIPGLDKLIPLDLQKEFANQIGTTINFISTLLKPFINLNEIIIQVLITALPGKELMRNPSSFPSSTDNHMPPFQSDMTKWISDQFFAEQRLSGVNPMTIQKVTLSNEIGMNINELKALLNPRFDLAQAVNKVLSQVTDNQSLSEAVQDGYLFVLYQPLNKLVDSSRDLTDFDPKRKMWEFKSPIAIFASTEANAALKPVAIQMDDKTDAKIYTPQDGDKWMLAKLNTQLADYSSSQITEHLCKVHFTAEPICLAVERQLSKNHPLFDMMRFHCRGIFTANTFGGPILLSDKLDLNKVLEFGSKGARILAQKVASTISWDDLDLKKNIKRRGVDDQKRLPYYPYRDDGLVLYDILEQMITDYVHAFYSSDQRVSQDHEVQNFAAELSAEKEGTIRGFPGGLDSKASLISTFTRILWIMTGQHTAINYPQADYSSYVPNLPTKLYNVDSVAQGSFSYEILENRNTTAIHLSLVSSLSSFRMDQLFDYGKGLKSARGQNIVMNYKRKLETKYEDLLRKRNQRRLKEGHLTYPYFQPRWLTNGIQA